MTLAQRRNIMKAFIDPQFGYCPLVLMFCGDKLMHDNVQELMHDNAQDRNYFILL